MMDGMKYIIIDNGMLEEAVIFSATRDHSYMAHAMNATNNVVSAGFVKVDDRGEIHTFGKSHTLNLRSREDDDRIIRRELQED